MASASDGKAKGPAKRTKFDYSDYIEVLVGVEEKRFMVHKDVICNASDFFKAACSGNWKESKDGVVRLPEQDVDAFQVFLHWLYTSKIEIVEEGERDAMATAKSGSPCVDVGPAFRRAVHSFILGDLIRCPEFCNAIIDSIMSHIADVNVRPDPPSVGRLWERLPAGSTFRRWLADLYAMGATVDAFDLVVKDFSREFVVDIARAGIHGRDMEKTKKPPRARGKCYYHEHATGSHKCA